MCYFIYNFSDVLPFFLSFQISGLYNFLSSKKTSFNISGPVGVLVMYFHSFCLPQKTFIFPSHLKDNFTGYRIPGWLFFFFQHIKYFLPLYSLCLFTWFLTEVSVPLLVKVFFSFFWLPSRFSLCFCCSLNTMCPHTVCLWVLGCLFFLVFSEIPGSVICCLSLMLKTLQTFSPQIFLLFCVLFLLFLLFQLCVYYTFWNNPTLHFHSLCISVWKVSDVLSSS